MTDELADLAVSHLQVGYLKQLVHEWPHCSVEHVFLRGMLIMDEVKIEVAKLRKQAAFATGGCCPKRDVLAASYLTSHPGMLYGPLIRR